MTDVWFTCEHPYVVYNKYTRQTVQVQCGHCKACQVRRLKKYLPLICNESSQHKYMYFFTLTYNNDNLPLKDVFKFIPEKKNYRPEYFQLLRESQDYVQFCHGLLPILDTEDIQKWFKRVRKLLDSRQVRFRYFVSGDYGETTFRPHYHGLLWFDSSWLAENIQDVFARTWKVGNQSIGRFEVEPARSKGQYAAAYTQMVADRPAIYAYREFKPKALFSSKPSFGSFWNTVETDRDIVLQGLNAVTVYDNERFVYKTVPLPASYLRRWFPFIPSFRFLDVHERFAIYQFLHTCLNMQRDDRLDYMLNHIQCDSFFRDYIYQQWELDDNQVIDKLDRLFYTYKRLVAASFHYGMSPYVYDQEVLQLYIANLDKKKINSQLDYEARLVLHQHDPLDVIDIERSVSGVNPRFLQPEYFQNMDELHKSLTKSKLNIKWLDEHPEYKVFH